MELTPFNLYLWQLANKVIMAALIFAAISTLYTILVLGPAGSEVEKEDYPAFIKRWRVKLSATLALVFALVCIFTPSSKDLAVMFVIPAIAKSDFAKKDMPELYEMALEKLKSELQPKGAK